MTLGIIAVLIIAAAVFSYCIAKREAEEREEQQERQRTLMSMFLRITTGTPVPLYVENSVKKRRRFFRWF